MKEDEINRECRRYDKRLRDYGPTVKTLGWRNRQQQELRFAILTEIGQLDGRTLLDVGCGFGDLFNFLVARGVEVRYTGIDINPSLLKIARERNCYCTFEEKDILHEKYDESQFDYVFASGLFNAKLANNESFAREMISEMFRISRRGISVNMMSSYVDYQDDHLHYYQPDEYFRLGKGLSRYVALRHDYPLYEFTLYIYKDKFSDRSGGERRDCEEEKEDSYS